MLDKKDPTHDTQLVYIKKSRAKYVIIPNALFWDVRLTPLDWRVYGIINSLSFGKARCCIMSNTTIAEQINSTRASVSKSVTKLVQLGLIQREIIFGKSNKRPVGKKLSTVETMLCVFRERISVDELTIDKNAEAPCGAEKVSSIVPAKEPNNNYNTKSYNISELEKIDTLDFID